MCYKARDMWSKPRFIADCYYNKQTILLCLHLSLTTKKLFARLKLSIN